jgi:triphosphoribosyl-dephospho-CoA synthase
MLGLLAAAAGALQERAEEVCDRSLRGLIRQRWSRDLCAGDALPTHGRWVALRYGAAGARGEAVHAFPGVFEIALPALRDALARGAGDERARLHALFSVLARVADTNLLYRGGPSGLDWMQAAAGAFLAGGSVFAAGWRERALAVHRACIARNLSPGGCADLLAAACFVHSLQGRGR